MGCESIMAQDKNKVFSKVVIDAGHGGVKPGAIGSKYKEKDITLAVSIKLGKLINEHLKPVKVYYTRVIDQDVDIYKRSTVANRLNADLFISIHCNSSTSKQAGGTETYAMGLGKTANNLEVAKKENAEILTESNSIQNYQGFDMDSPEGDILMSLYQNAYLQNSLDIAAKIQNQYSQNVPMKSRGVHQANFVVLWKAAMPAILTEIGFISNTKEESYIGSEYGQWIIASCIFLAICEYRNKTDNAHYPIPKIESLIPVEVVNRERIRKEQEALERKRLAEIEQQKQDSIAKASKNKETEQLKPSIATDTIQKSGAEVLYRVQFLSSPKKLAKNDTRLQDLEDIYFYNEKNSWKYTCGVFASQKEALNYQNKVRQRYKDAFVVAFFDGKRVSIVEAQRLKNHKQ